MHVVVVVRHGCWTGDGCEDELGGGEDDEDEERDADESAVAMMRILQDRAGEGRFFFCQVFRVIWAEEMLFLEKLVVFGIVDRHDEGNR